MQDSNRHGPSWRKDCAVLESWSNNGHVIELVVPEGGIYAWEGKIASQIENGGARTFGQFLPGGDTQVFIDFAFNEANWVARDEVLKLTPETTNWSGLSGINVPEKDVTVQKLGRNQESFNRGSRRATSRTRARS